MRDKVLGGAGSRWRTSAGEGLDVNMCAIRTDLYRAQQGSGSDAEHRPFAKHAGISGGRIVELHGTAPLPRASTVRHGTDCLGARDSLAAAPSPLARHIKTTTVSFGRRYPGRAMRTTEASPLACDLSLLRSDRRSSCGPHRFCFDGRRRRNRRRDSMIIDDNRLDEVPSRRPTRTSEHARACCP